MKIFTYCLLTPLVIVMGIMIYQLNDKIKELDYIPEKIVKMEAYLFDSLDEE